MDPVYGLAIFGWSCIGIAGFCAFLGWLFRDKEKKDEVPKAPKIQSQVKTKM